MNKTERLIKLATDENGYQDILKDGKKIFEGYRDCEERWHIINEYIHPNQVTIDLGSNYGYFAYKVATKDPSNLVWSIESGSLRHEVHQLMLEVNNIRNVILSKHQLSLIDLLNLNRTCETVDMFLAFSVIHYFPIEQIPSILEAISRFSRALIIEFPSPDESHVANKELVDKLNPEQMLNQVYDHVKIIGSVPSPKHKNVRRNIYFCENYSITRDRAKSYISAKVGKSHKVELKNGWWTIDGQKRRITGINLANLAAFNVTYPSLNYLMDKSAQSYYDLIQHQEGKVTDIHPRNILVGARELYIIDFKENIGKKIYGISWKQYKDSCLEADQKTIKKDLALKFATGDTRAFLNEDDL